METSQAGPGNLEVTVNGGRVPTSAQAQGPHTYAISFTPRQPTLHTVHLRFNNHDVPGKILKTYILVCFINLITNLFIILCNRKSNFKQFIFFKCKLVKIMEYFIITLVIKQILIHQFTCFVFTIYLL